MTFDQNARNENESLKFVEDDSGDVAIRVKLTDGVHLEEGSTFDIYDHRGFLVFRVDEDGNVSIKGEVRSLR